MPKRHIEPLVNGRVRLRLLEEADLPMTLAWRNQDHIRRWFMNAATITPQQHTAWYTAYRDRDDDFVFMIEETDTLHRPVGQVSLYHVDRPARRAEFGRLMIGDPDATGQGLAALATLAVVAHAFEAHGLDEVYLEVKPANARAVAVYTACGFIETGRGDDVVRMTNTGNRYPNLRANG